MPRPTFSHVKLALRLCFVKLPGTKDHRIFRDVMLLHEPEDKCYQDLADVVEKKLTFMDFPPADFTVFYTEKDTGDRVVVDDAYFSALVTDWFRPVFAHVQHSQTRRASQGGSPINQSPRCVASRPPEGLLGDPSDVSSTSSTSRGGGEGHGAVLEIPVAFDIEVNRLRSSGPSTGPSLHAVGDSGPLPSPSTPPATSGAPNREGFVNGPDAVRRPTCAPLTVENLTALMRQGTSTAPPAAPPATPALPPPPPPLSSTVGQDALVRVRDLVCPPNPPNFVLRCVPIDIRFKIPKPGLTIGEVDLCDVADPRQVVTGVTFDATVQKEMKERLRCDGRQVLELRHVYVRRKNEWDMRYATNPHPLLLRIDRSSQLEVVQILAVPVTLRAPVVSSSGPGAAEPHVISVRDSPALRSGAVMELADLTRLRGSASAHAAGALYAGSPSDVGVGGVSGFLGGVPSSSSSSTGPRRTTFTLGSGHNQSSSALHTDGMSGRAVGPLPSAYGTELRLQQRQFLEQAQARLQQQQRQQQLPYEPGVIAVTRRDVCAREAVVERDAHRESDRKERVRRKTEVSQACILCGLDLSDGSGGRSVALVRRMLEANYRNKGTDVPSPERLHDALCDRRPLLAQRQNTTTTTPTTTTGTKRTGSRPTRLTCTQTFVNMQTRTNHVVHCRCAHLCTEYQNGGSIEDLAWCDLPTTMCSLCGLPGAFVACYHPDCKEVYHSVCALFSGGYVNFGKKDPFLPCPACPHHTQVVLSHGRTQPSPGVAGGDGESAVDVLHVDTSCWEDEDIAFDSRVVAAGDLRDPDQNDGE